MDDAAKIPFTEALAPPRLAVPPGAVDCHHHIYDAAAPVAPGARPHGSARLADHARLLERLRVDRHVLVQPSTYGLDNALHLAALRQAGPARARMVAVVRPDFDAGMAREMAAAGVVGARANLVQGIPLAPADVAPLARRMADLGWHLQIFASAALIAELAPVLRAAPCPVVFDHFAQLPLSDWAAHPAWGVVMDLVQAGRGWVKLSSPYSLDQARPEAVGPLARALVEAAPERMVWGTNWPHPNAEAIPDDAALLDLLADWAPQASTRQAILVDNPAQLYGFG
ncbi:amidohydrolase family protein [Falsiroseomonas tokyonensis]|uniref:Amidohydrolase family protein n=1 Tax=Falsiroseomonas tokyonensis TaxID=430521 RepID=A0ABV7BQR9_9PROT|nr:amidohydrolase family protein [Falsiroseomonas tokyonensis]MBU8537007.1 amidohydrolase family protein [Falsiroseomonas tokyonensis]